MAAYHQDYKLIILTLFVAWVGQSVIYRSGPQVEAMTEITTKLYYFAYADRGGGDTSRLLARDITL